MDCKRILVLAAVLGLLGGATGCIFSPEDDNGGGGGEPAPALPFAGSQDQLMTNWQTVYENLDFDGYLEVLDTRFKIYLQEKTRQDFGIVNPYFSYEEDVRITRNMFSGDAPNDTTGGVTAVVFTSMTPIGTWEPSQNPDFPNGDPQNPDIWFRTYDVSFTFEVGTGDTRKDLDVNGEIEFYLSSQQVTHEGRERTQYKMIGQVDLTDG